jgi:uridine kinase
MKETIEPYVIGLTGLSGSGKTFYVNRLKELLGTNLCVLGFDDYYKPLQEQLLDEYGEANYDLPTALYADRFYQDLLKLIEYKSIVIKKYQFEHYDAPEIMEIIEPAPIVLVEGLFVMEFKAIDSLLKYRVFIDCDTQVCFERRLERDVKERNIPRERSLHQWDFHVLPAYRNYIEPHKNRCDLVVENIGPPEGNIQTILADIRKNAHPSVLNSLGTF